MNYLSINRLAGIVEVICIGVLSFDGQEEMDSRKEQWILHYIKEKSDSENLIELFRVLQDMGNVVRKTILCFLGM